MSFVPKLFSSVFGGGGGGAPSQPSVPAVPPPAPAAAPPPAPAPPTSPAQPPSFVPSLSPGQKSQKAGVTATSLLGAGATTGPGSQSAQKTLLGA